MQYDYFSQNGAVLPTEQAIIPVSNIHYAYGFGVYETIRVQNGVIYFLDDHVKRLIESARIISLEHPFSEQFIQNSAKVLVEKVPKDTFNLKMLLIGGETKDTADLFIECLNPFFPDRKLYQKGASCISYNYERAYPQAKSLNMMQSYMAYRKARECGAYDALLIDQKGNITEGTRTNFFCLKGKTIITPPEGQILFGIMRKVVLNVAEKNSFTISQETIPLQSVGKYDGAFLTSTSSKVMPIGSIDDREIGAPTPNLKLLMNKTTLFLEVCRGYMPN